MNRNKRRAHKKKTASSLQTRLDLAERLLARGSYDQAAQAYRNILAVEPEDVTALFNLGNICHRREFLDEAASCFSRILAICPQDNEARLVLAFVHMDQGNIDDALAQAAALKKADLPATGLTRLGILYRESGEFDEARVCFDRAIALDPGHVEAYYSLRTLKKFPADDPDFIRLVALEKNAASLGGNEKIRLGFTLGKAYLDQGRDKESFAHFAAANALKKIAYKTPVSLYEDYAQNVIGFFNEDFVANLKDSGGSDSNRPIFIVGMPRSGSTLIDQILSSHPDVASIGESRFLSQCIPAFPNAEVPGLFKEGRPSVTRELVNCLDAQSLQRIANNYLERVCVRTENAPRVIDKMLFNFYWVGLLRLVFPNAKIIHTVRHPADIGLSIWQIMFSDAMPWAYDLEDIARFYKAYEKIMAHWERLFPGEIYRAEYESLVADPETKTKELLAFCELPFDERCLRFYENTRQVKTASAGQVRAPVYKSAVGKWERHREYLVPLLEGLKVG